MLSRIFLFITGILLTSLSLTAIILYLNLLNMGYSFMEYVNFISIRFECLLMFLGIALIIISLLKRKEKKNDIYL